MQRKNKGLGRHDGKQQCCGGLKKLIRPIRCLKYATDTVGVTGRRRPG